MNASPFAQMPDDIDFSQGLRGQFYRADMTLNLPVYLDDEVQTRLARLATAKGVELSELANALLRKDLELIDMAMSSMTL